MKLRKEYGIFLWAVLVFLASFLAWGYWMIESRMIDYQLTTEDVSAEELWQIAKDHVEIHSDFEAALPVFMELYDRYYYHKVDQKIIKDLVPLELAWCYYGLKDKEQALEWFKRAKNSQELELADQAHYMLGVIYYKLGDQDKAMLVFGEMLRGGVLKYYDKAVAFIAQIYANRQDYDSAIKMYKELPDSVVKFDRIAWCFKQLGNYEQAYRTYIQAHRLSPHIHGYKVEIEEMRSKVQEIRYGKQA